MSVYGAKPEKLCLLRVFRILTTLSGRRALHALDGEKIHHGIADRRDVPAWYFTTVYSMQSGVSDRSGRVVINDEHRGSACERSVMCLDFGG